MDYWYSSWEDSIVSKLQSSKFTGGIYCRVIDSLYPFIPFINPFFVPPGDPSTIPYLSKNYSSVLYRSLSVLPNILMETPNMSKDCAMEFLDVYRLCIDCLDIIAPELGDLRASLDHRYYYICCLRHWKKYDEAKSECKIVLDKFNMSMYETFGYEREDNKVQIAAKSTMASELTEGIEDSEIENALVDSVMGTPNIDTASKEDLELTVVKILGPVEEKHVLVEEKDGTLGNLESENGQMVAKVIRLEEHNIKRRVSDEILSIVTEGSEECVREPMIKESIDSLSFSGENYHVKMFTTDHGISPSLSHSSSHFLGVYDGHGGLQVANYCRDCIHLFLEEEFKSVKDELVSGTTIDTQKMKWEKVFTSSGMRLDGRFSPLYVGRSGYSTYSPSSYNMGLNLDSGLGLSFGGPNGDSELGYGRGLVSYYSGNTTRYGGAVGYDVGNGGNGPLNAINRNLWGNGNFNYGTNSMTSNTFLGSETGNSGTVGNYGNIGEIWGSSQGRGSGSLGSAKMNYGIGQNNIGGRASYGSNNGGVVGAKSSFSVGNDVGDGSSGKLFGDGFVDGNHAWRSSSPELDGYLSFGYGRLGGADGGYSVTNRSNRGKTGFLERSLTSSPSAKMAPLNSELYLS